MPTFIPARGRTLHVAGVCINRIGKGPTRALFRYDRMRLKVSVPAFVVSSLFAARCPP